MEILFIPDIIRIELTDDLGKPLRQENILLGIQTFANHKNNIDIYPFLSDQDGRLTITKEQVKQRADIFISYGIMDYAPLEYAKPDIEVYYWGNNKLDQCINYWSMLLKNKKNRKVTEMEKKLLGHLEQKFAEIEERETQELQIFTSCFNRSRKQKQDIILVCDSWDKQVNERSYIVSLSV
jgi:hypothetical protein